MSRFRGGGRSVKSDGRRTWQAMMRKSAFKEKDERRKKRKEDELKTTVKGGWRQEVATVWTDKSLSFIRPLI